MPRKSARAALILSFEQRARLTDLAGSRTAPAREVERAKLLLGYADGATITELQRLHRVSRPMIYKCVDRALADGVQMGLKDRNYRPRISEISEEAKAWVIKVSASSPKAYGLRRDAWTIAGLHRFVVKNAEAAGYARLATSSKSTFWRILNASGNKPLGARNSAGAPSAINQRASQTVLMIRREASIQSGQAVLLPPLPSPSKKCGADIDAASANHATLTIIAAIDLQTGHIFAQVESQEGSSQSAALLNEVDRYFPPTVTIRMILDKHSIQICPHTQQFIESRPQRFSYRIASASGSWLNLIENTCTKVLCALLRQVGTGSRDEIREQLLRAIAEVNDTPGRFKVSRLADRAI